MRRPADGIDSLAPRCRPVRSCADAVGRRRAPRSEFREVERDESGFPRAQVITASVMLPPGRYRMGPDIVQFNQQLIDAARAIPGVTAVGTGTDRPLHVDERRAFTAD